MIRKLALAVSIAVGSLPFSVHAVGLGDIKTYSRLNENFKAEIALHSVEKGQLDMLKVQLAPPKVFARMGVERPYFLSRLKFQPVRLKNGKAVIKVSSDFPIAEPYLDFFIKLVWPEGQLIKEYSVLLDPPRSIKRKAATQATKKKLSKAPKAQPATVQQPVSVSQPAFNGDQYTIQRGDTLWTIAERVKDDEVSVHQMMMALYQENPQAFIKGNINLLRSGAVLTIPEVEVVKQLSRREAVRQFQAQIAAHRPKPQPEPEVIAEEDQGYVQEGQLKLSGAAPLEEEPMAEEAMAVGNADLEAKTQAMKQRLMLLEEEVAASKQEREAQQREIAELSEKIRRLEKKLEINRQLLKMKDKRLAELQAALQAKTAAEPMAEETGMMGDADMMEEAPTLTEGGMDMPETGLMDEAEPLAPETTLPEATEIPEETVFTEPEIPVLPEADELEQETIEALQAEPEPPAPKPVETAPPLAEEEPAAESGSWMNQNWPLLAAGGGGAIALIAVLLFLVRRKEQQKNEYAPVQLPTEEGETVPMAASTFKDDDEAESILLAKESDSHLEPPSLNEETSFLSEFDTREFRANDSSTTTETDPVAEADVYIAYGRYKKAEEIIQHALDAGSTDPLLKTKMLEIHYATKDKDAFLSLAQEVHDSGFPMEEPKTWKRIQAMGRELDPGNPIFSIEEPLSETSMSTTLTDTHTEMSLDLSMLADEAQEGLGRDSEQFDVLGELDLGSLEKLSEEDSALGDSVLSEESSSGLRDSSLRDSSLNELEHSIQESILQELNIEEEADTEDKSFSKLHEELLAGDFDKLPEDETGLHTELAEDSLSDLGLSIPLDEGKEEEITDLSNELEDILADSHIEEDLVNLEDERLSDLSDTVNPITQEIDVSDEVPSDFEEATDANEEAETKLDLAKAFIEIGDIEGARDLLKEVQATGSNAQKQAAIDLLAQISNP